MNEGKQYKALLQERADLTREGREIFERAEKETRGLTAEEKTRDDAINARLPEIAADLKRHEDRRQREREIEALPQSGLTLPEGARIAVGDDRAAAHPFRTLGENLMAAVQLATTHQLPPAYRSYVEHVQQMFAATGLNESVGSEGGVLVQTDFIAGLLKPMHEDGPFSTRVNNIPVSADANGVTINAVDETSRATGSRWGGVQGYRLAEAQTKTASKPAFRRIELKLKKYAVLAYSTDELLQDSTALEAILTQAAGEELNFMVNDDILNGTGVGGALGILNSGAVVTVAKESGQAAATVINANISKMWARLQPRNYAGAVWFVNSEVLSQLDTLSIPAGTGAIEPRYVTYGPDGVQRIKGKPVIVTEFNAALGTVGDIVLADLSDYLAIDKGGVQYATSIHVQFLTDETAFRFVYRYDGQPTMKSAITPYKGSATQSAYVALATRA